MWYLCMIRDMAESPVSWLPNEVMFQVIQYLCQHYQPYCPDQ